MTFGQGVGFLRQGLRLWRERTGLMLLGLIPAVIVMLVIIALFVVLVMYADELVAWATPFADGWDETVRGIFRGVLYAVVLAGAAMLSIVTFTGLTLAVGDPFYEKIWKEVEISLGGDIPESGVGWLRGAVDGLVLVGFGILTAICVFLLGFLPVIGTMVGFVVGLIVAGRLLAAELVSRPLEARGMDRPTRAALMKPHRGAMLGFGVCVQVCFMIPLGGVMVMPAAVAGATYFARAALEAAPAAVQASGPVALD